MIEWRDRNRGVTPVTGGSGHRLDGLTQESVEPRIPGITRGEPGHLVAGVPLERCALRRIARRLAYQRRGEDPAGLDARQISLRGCPAHVGDPPLRVAAAQSHDLRDQAGERARACRSEEHTSELQSQSNLVCRLLLEKKKEALNYTEHAHQLNTPIPLLASLPRDCSH